MGGAKIKNLVKRIVDRSDKRSSFFLRIPENAKVLDLGCGSGGNGIALRSFAPAAELEGVDILRDPNLPDFYSFAALDLDNGLIPFPDSYFDVIVFTHVIEHLRAPLALGPEVRRVMKPGGAIYVETPNWTTVLVPSFSIRREQHSPFNFYDDPTHVKPWTRHGLFEFLFQGCQLNVTKVGTTRNWARLPFDLLLVVHGLLTGNRRQTVSSFWNIYGWCIYAVATKD